MECFIYIFTDKYIVFIHLQFVYYFLNKQRLTKQFIAMIRTFSTEIPACKIFSSIITIKQFYQDGPFSEFIRYTDDRLVFRIVSAAT